MKHTPGPWSVIPATYTVDGLTVRGCHVNGNNNRKILFDIVPGRNTDAPTELAFANANLAAAAPDMLEALLGLGLSMPSNDAPCHVGICPQDECGHCRRIAAALAAIDKALGGAA